MADPVIQQLEVPAAGDVSVNDCFRPVSQYFDPVSRPEQLPSALLSAMWVLTDPAETGAVTLCLPEDAQAEAQNWPDELLAPLVWHVARPAAHPAAVTRAVEVLRTARPPLIVAGGGVIYADATATLADLAARTGIPVAETQAGKGSLPFDHPQSVGATGATAANALARDADDVVGIGTTVGTTVGSEPLIRRWWRSWALHHYDHLGLVSPSARSAAGYRLYVEADVERLYQVLALRQLGLPPDAIDEVLDGASSIEGLLESHRAYLDRQMVAIRTLRAQLRSVADASKFRRATRRSRSPTSWNSSER